MKSKRLNKKSLSGHYVAIVLLAGTVLCFTTLGAQAQQPAVSQTPDAAMAPASTPQSPAAQAAPAAASQAGTLGEQGPTTIHVMVGHSLLIRTPSRVKRILTGNPAVIESVLTSPRELVITGKLPGGSSLMLWDEAGQNRTLDVYADLDVTSLRNTLDQSFPNSGVDVQSEADKVMVVGTVPSAAVADQILKMAANFSKEVVNGLQLAEPARLKQVMLKVRFAEADRQKVTNFGVNIFSTGATNTIGTISTQQFGAQALQPQSGNPLNTFSFSNLLNIFLFRPDINLGATISDLQQKNILQILAEPNLMALSGQPARFLAGGEFPYPVVQGGAAGTVPIVTIEFKPYGVKLEFTGTILADGSIRLKVVPEVSSLDYSNTVTISGFVLPSISTRRAETVVELKDGQSFGVAGLLDDRTTVQLSKIPGIGDIPILGQLFRSRNVNRSNTELIVLVTPTIVDPVGGGPVPSMEPVNYPVQHLDNEKFDKGLPSPTVSSPAKSPETK